MLRALRADVSYRFFRCSVCAVRFARHDQDAYFLHALSRRFFAHTERRSLLCAQATALCVVWLRKVLFRIVRSRALRNVIFLSALGSALQNAFDASDIAMRFPPRALCETIYAARLPSCSHTYTFPGVLFRVSRDAFTRRSFRFAILRPVVLAAVRVARSRIALWVLTLPVQLSRATR